jgi:prepilin-type N-terminal cleavage/methylation domain-containing protein
VTKLPIRKKQSNGFTIVEVLVTAAILAIGLMGAATMISRSTIQDSRAYYTTRGSMMVEEFLENATRMQYSALDFRDMTGANLQSTIDGVDYNMNCILANNTPMDRCKEMTCTLNWNNKGIQASTQYVYVYSPKY